VFQGLSVAPDQLSGLVNGFEQTMSTLASRQQQLGATIADLPGLLSAANTADVNLQQSLPELARFSTDLLPGLHQLAPTLTVALPWVRQLTTLSGSGELGGLLRTLTPAVRGLRAASKPLQQLVGQSGLLARCVSGDLVPTGNQTISDPPQTSTEQLYRELFQSSVGIASAAQDFDGNGRYVRVSTAGGGTLVQTPTLPVNGPLFGNAVLSPLGTRPALTASAPPLNGNRDCYRNAAPDLNSASTGVGP
jgi:phospholipid/cholesterol/gamma-HCH transport system substrate-binding protein